MANLLIQTTPHQVLPELAEKIGINEALFLQQLHFLIVNNDCHEYKGMFWYCHTLDQWCEKFPYFSKSTFRRTVDSCQKKGFIHKEKLHWKLLGVRSDTTVWYTINYEEIQVISDIIQKEINDKRLEKARKNQDVALGNARYGQNEHLTSVQNEHLTSVQNEQTFNKIYNKIEKKIKRPQADASKLAVASNESTGLTSKSNSEKRKAGGQEQQTSNLRRQTGARRANNDKSSTKSPTKLETYPEGLNIEFWHIYLEYRKSQFNFRYKTARSEIIAANKLIRDTGANQELQREYVENAIANGWKGLFPVKQAYKTSDRKVSGENFFENLQD